MAKSKQVKVTKAPSVHAAAMPAPCPTCGGTGVQKFIDPGGRVMNQQCFHCKGTGKVNAWIKPAVFPKF